MTQRIVIPEDRSRYDLNLERPLPRVIEVNTGLLPEAWRKFCEEHRIRLFTLLGYENPVQNIKIWPASNIIARGIERGDHVGKKKVTDSTSGNYGWALKFVIDEIRRRWPEFSIEEVVSVIPRTTPQDKLDLLEEAGIKLVFADSAIAAMQLAERIAAEENLWYTRQYWNLDNSGAYPPIIEEIVEKFPEIGAMGVGAGSAGSAAGMFPTLEQALQRVDFTVRKPSQQLLRIAVVVEDGESVDGVRPEAALKPGSLPWREATDEVRFVGEERSIIMSAALWRNDPNLKFEPCYGGLSSGFQLEGLLLALRNLGILGRLGPLRDRNGDVQAFFLAPDTRKPYRIKYEKRGIYLSESEWGLPTFK